MIVLIVFTVLNIISSTFDEPVVSIYVLYSSVISFTIFNLTLYILSNLDKSFTILLEYIFIFLYPFFNNSNNSEKPILPKPHINILSSIFFLSSNNLEISANLDTAILDIL